MWPEKYKDILVLTTVLDRMGNSVPKEIAERLRSELAASAKSAGVPFDEKEGKIAF
ncbi:MAG: hypothetical protein IPH75_08135 [bacterium]|nr:hypothetical protein [bacterium]